MTQTITPATDTAPASLPRYALMYGSGTTLMSDSLSALIPVIVDGYTEFTGDITPEQVTAATVMRVDFLTRIAAAVQSGFAQAAEASGEFDPANCGDEILTELFKDRRIPFEGITGPDGQPSLEWTFDVPLILIASDYHPFTARPAPTGGVMFLDGSTELAFLTSLSDLGLISLNVAADASHQ